MISSRMTKTHEHQTSITAGSGGQLISIWQHGIQFRVDLIHRGANFSTIYAQHDFPGGSGYLFELVDSQGQYSAIVFHGSHRKHGNKVPHKNAYGWCID